MCVKKQLYTDKTALEVQYGANFALDFVGKRYENAYDFEPGPVTTSEMPKQIQMFRWGLVPPFATDLARIAQPINTINCRSEAMFTTPSFQESAVQGKRCLIPSTAFFEAHWSSVNKKTPKNKIPFKIFAKAQEIFSIAGLYSYWKDKTTGKELFTYTVLTTEAKGVMRYIHNNPNNPGRMPVILTKALEKDWLNPNLNEKQVLELCKSMPDEFLTAHTISKAINNPKISSAEKDHPDFDKPLAYTPEELDEVKHSKVPQEIAIKKARADQQQQLLF